MNKYLRGPYSVIEETQRDYQGHRITSLYGEEIAATMTEDAVEVTEQEKNTAELLAASWEMWSCIGGILSAVKKVSPVLLRIEVDKAIVIMEKLGYPEE